MIYNKSQIAKNTGLSRATISKIFNQKTNSKVETLEKIALELNCSIDELRTKLKNGEV